MYGKGYLDDLGHLMSTLCAVNIHHYLPKSSKRQIGLYKEIREAEKYKWYRCRPTETTIYRK